MKTGDKLKKIQALMVEHQLDVYLVPTTDPYLSEYPPDCYKRLKWLTGFSGSFGIAAIMANGKHVLFTDGRYMLQASQQLDGELFKVENISGLTLHEYPEIKNNCVGIDPWCHSASFVRKFTNVVSIQENLVDSIWQDRPEMPCSDVVDYSMEYAGVSRQDKMNQLISVMNENAVDACLLTAPDSICWLLNIRGRDVACTPLVLCYALIYADGRAEVYLDKDRLKVDFNNDIEIISPKELINLNKKLKNKRIMVDEVSLPYWFSEHLSGIETINKQDPCQLLKSCKNDKEISWMRATHKKDGEVVWQCIEWIKEQVASKEDISELDVIEKLVQLRQTKEGFVEPSFDTICGFGSNGAIIHYKADERTNKVIQGSGLLLIDSGGQYLGGTTDITRTIAIGKPMPDYIKHYTLVLKGHIALAMAKFPRGTSGSQLDILARQYLWQEGLDYDHGTGHGVGAYLGVHEGPARISKMPSKQELLPGMVLSNEPGYYVPNEYGIRIESLVVVVEKEDGFLGFDTLTKVPLEEELIDRSMLGDQELAWLDAYQQWCLDGSS